MTNDQKNAKKSFYDYLTMEMIRDNIAEESIPAYLQTVEMIVGEEILNPESMYSAEKIPNPRERGRHALPWPKSTDRQVHLEDVMECIILRHQELSSKHAGNFAGRITYLKSADLTMDKQAITEDELKMIEVVALGFWNA